MAEKTTGNNPPEQSQDNDRDDKDNVTAGDAAPIDPAEKAGATNAFCTSSAFVSFLKTPRFEATGRTVLGSFLCYVLLVVYIPRAVPPSNSSLIGFLGPIISLVTPFLAFALGAAGPVLIVAFVLILAVGSAQLAASTVSSGLMSATFAIFALWFTSLRHGPDEGMTSSFMGLLNLSGMLTLSLFATVQNGISFTIHGNEEISDFVRSLLVELCLFLGRESTCWEESLPVFEGTVGVTIPDGNFAGRTAWITHDNGSLTVSIEGGLWFVAGLWKWQGLTNPLAIVRNMLIAVCWVFLCVGCAVLCPPIRTLKRNLSRALVPAAIKDVVGAVKDNLSLTNEKDEDSAPDNEERAEPQDSDEMKKMREVRIIATANTIGDGSSAALSAYELRLCRAPFECTWPKLQALMTVTNGALISALSMYIDTSLRHWHEAPERRSEALERLEKCAVALTTNGEVGDLGRRADEADDEEEGKETLHLETRALNARVTRIESATVDWLNAVHNPTSAGCKGVFIAYVPFVAGFLKIIKRLVLALALPFQPKRWNLRTLLIDMKFAVGLTGLFLMEVYWDAYRDFTLRAGNISTSIPTYITSNTESSPQNFSGWALIGYIFSTTPTVEGSIKKGLLRAIGTVLGGFSAWVGIILCSGSYDESAPINPYGLVAYLTFFTALGSYFAYDDGPGALMGTSADHGYGAFYFVMTQGICASKIFAGASRDNIVVNRIVANLVGITMATVVTLLPPHVWGGDPQSLKDILAVERDALMDGLRSLLLAGEGADEEKTNGTTKDLKDALDKYKLAFEAKRKHATFLIKDADKLRIMPCFRVDSRMREQLNALSITGSFVYRALDLVKHVVGKDTGGILVSNPKLRDGARSALVRLEGDRSSAEDENGKDEDAAIEDVRDEHKLENVKEVEDVEFFVQMLDSIVERIEAHDAVLADIHV